MVASDRLSMPASRLAAMPASASPLSAALAILDDDIEFTRCTRQPLAPNGRQWAESSLRIGGMHCAARATRCGGSSLPSSVRCR